MVTFDDLGGRYAGLAAVMREQTNLPVNAGSYLLLSDESPSDYTWTWIVGLLCLSFVILDAYFIIRWFKPQGWERVAKGEDA